MIIIVITIKIIPTNEGNEKCSSESYGSQLRQSTGYRVKKLADTLEKENVRSSGSTFHIHM